MFSTPLGKQRLANLPNAVLRYLGKLVKESGADPDNFVLETFINPNVMGTDFRIWCKTCKGYRTQVACDWSTNYALDILIKSVLEFTNDHQHRPQPVLDIAGSLPPALVEYPKGYRKFREV